MYKLKRNHIIEYTWKVIWWVLIGRLAEGTKEKVAEGQGGFRSGRDCVNKIFVLKKLVVKYNM